MIREFAHSTTVFLCVSVDNYGCDTSDKGKEKL